MAVWLLACMRCRVIDAVVEAVGVLAAGIRSVGDSAVGAGADQPGCSLTRKGVWMQAIGMGTGKADAALTDRRCQPLISKVHGLNRRPEKADTWTLWQVAHVELFHQIEDLRHYGLSQNADRRGGLQQAIRRDPVLPKDDANAFIE